MKAHYAHQEIEKKWQQIWQEQKLFDADVTADKEKYYCLDMFPYPSGLGLHVGHWRGYILSDVYARHARLQGKNVLHPMGFDSFGLPAENAAIKHKSNPQKFTTEAIETITNQLKEMGSSFDWTKLLSTSDQNYYRWTQWLFLQFYKHGYAYKRTSLVNWCPNDQTVLANEQVINGCCERCGATVTKRELAQWYLKTTAFAQDLLDGLNTVEWPERVKALQRDWIGKSEGAEVEFDSPVGPISVFTTRLDTIFGVTALVLAPEHPFVPDLTTKDRLVDLEKYLKSVQAKTNIDRQQSKNLDKAGFFTGMYAKHPLTNEDIPIWLADYVLMEYGTGAVMCVPAHDERDFQFATIYDLPITQVISPSLVQQTEPAKYRADQPTIKGESVIAFIKHPTEEKYLGLDWTESSWGAKTLLTGTIEDLSPEETLLKEIKEETGYQNAKIVKKMGVIDGLFYHLPKQTNKLVRGHAFLVVLVDETKTNIEDHEAKRHQLKWLTVQELASFLTPATHQFLLHWLKNGYQPFTDTGALVNSGKYDWLTSEEAKRKIVAELEKQDKGCEKVIYKLRDWLVSRQRYWGPPIPIVYDADGKPHPVDESELPLTLPIDVDFLPGGESPIARSREYIERAEQKYGLGWRYETDTLDTFVDSSWYFLRYLTPQDNKQAFDPELVKKWLPVDLYIGGIEHATLHLLYARFVTRFLSEHGYIDKSITEPFKNLFSIGAINLHGAKMSKSKGNVVNPDELIEHYGTDTLRGYELFIGPMDVEAEWNSRGLNGIYRFLIKLFQTYSEYEEPTNSDQQIEAEFAKYLQDINEMLIGFRLNTVIASAMKLLPKLGNTASKEIMTNFLITLFPIFPFITEELYQKLGNEKSIIFAAWPKVNETLMVKLLVNVLINNKFVEAIELDKDDLDFAVSIAKANSKIAEKLAGKKITNTFYKPQHHLLNIVIEG